MAKNEMMLINGDVITLSEKPERPKNLVIKNGKIAAFDPPLPREIGITGEREIIDLRGKSVIPGLADSHVHFTHVGLGLVFPDFSIGAGAIACRERSRKIALRLG